MNHHQQCPPFKRICVRTFSKHRISKSEIGVSKGSMTFPSMEFLVEVLPSGRVEFVFFPEIVFERGGKEENTTQHKNKSMKHLPFFNSCFWFL